MTSTPNPLLAASDLPHFSKVRPEHIGPAIAELLAEARQTLSEVSATVEPSWESVVAPLARVHERLSRIFGVVGHLNAVVNTPELREAYNAALAEITRYYTELGLNRELYERYRQIAEASAPLTSEQRRLLACEIRDFRLSGIELEGAARERYQTIQDRLAQASARFADNLLDAVNAFVLDVPVSELAGVPEDVVAVARDKAQAAGLAPDQARLTLQAPCYVPVMQYADSRRLRERLYRAYATRASEEGDARFDNGSLIEEILALRQELARLLGYASYADYSLVPKMAESAEEVERFILDMARRARPYAERDLAELRSFAAAELGLPDVEVWDLAWVSEKLRQKRYDFSQEELRAYFPEPQVLAGLFRVIETLYSVRIVPAEPAPGRWHPDVRYYRIEEGEGAHARLVGEFYLDLFARADKQGGAWADTARTRILQRSPEGERLATPIAFLTCNFPAPVGDRPALFTHDDVVTLFHEFGHGLHLLLTEVDLYGLSGFGHVEWDAVELPSQFMENYCWQWPVLAGMTRHVETGEALPRALFERMWAARNFQIGLATLRQMEYALFDLRLHRTALPMNRQGVLALLDEVRKEVAVIHPPAYSRMPWSFSHIFAGGYAAGYYSYQWAEVLSADAFSRFEEEGILSATAGHAFRKEVLARGGSRPALENFIAFRGRAPSLEPLLRINGMMDEAQA